MDIKIDCEAFVALDAITKIIKCNCEVLEYQCYQDTLKGNVKIYGEFNKNSDEKTYEFNDAVPFSIVFKNENYKVLNLQVMDFQYNIKEYEGIDCKFIIYVEYDEKEIAKNEEIVLGEKIKLPEEEINFNEDNIISESTNESNDEEITNEFNEKLDDVLNGGRNECDEIKVENEAFEDANEEIEINNKPEIINNNKSNVFLNTQDSKNTIISRLKDERMVLKLYYCKNESDLNSISTKEGVSINKLLSDSSEKEGYRRIIIKK